MRHLGLCACALGLATLGTAIQVHAQEPAIQLRRIWCANEFVPQQSESFCLEELKQLNGLTDSVWDAVRRQIIQGMKAKGYRYEQKTGQLRVSYGAFPPNDVSHPVTGLFLKLRVGTRLIDQPKWTAGAMAEAPYVESTMLQLADKLTAQVPSRTRN